MATTQEVDRTLAYVPLRVLQGVLVFLSILMFGLALKQDWPTAGSLLLYGPVAAALLFHRARYDTTWLGLRARLKQRT